MRISSLLNRCWRMTPPTTLTNATDAPRSNSIARKRNDAINGNFPFWRRKLRLKNVFFYRSLDRLRSVRQRRFQLEHSALEFFFDVAENVFLDFASPNDQHRVIQEIALLKPVQKKFVSLPNIDHLDQANFDAVFMSPPRNLLRKLDLTKQVHLVDFHWRYVTEVGAESGKSGKSPISSI
jgi:hypothetical protein